MQFVMQIIQKLISKRLKTKMKQFVNIFMTSCLGKSLKLFGKHENCNLI